MRSGRFELSERRTGSLVVGSSAVDLLMSWAEQLNS
jgi:hypothetical protein